MCTQCARMIRYAHMMRISSAVSLFNRVSGERETFGEEEGRGYVRLRSLHDTYFYAHSFAPAYGRARATRIDKE